MLDKVCFLVNYNLYESKRYFTRKFAEALNRKGVETKVFDVKESALNADTIESIKRYAPDLTASFNSLLPVSENKYLWDYLKIPHWSILVDPAVYSLQYTKSPYSILSCVDASDLEAIRSNQFSNAFFFPHAVEKELAPGNEKRIYDVVFLGSCYDYESLRASWRQRNVEGVNKVLDDAIELFFSRPEMSLAQALATAWRESKQNPAGVDFSALFYYLDNYTRGKDRVELIRSIKDAHVHVFGDLSKDNAVGILGWKQYLAKQPNVTLHESVPYWQAMNVLRQSKICLNSMPFFKQGSHERVLAGLACGAVPITTENAYFRQFFKEGQDLHYYDMGNREAVNALVNNLLSDEGKRQTMAAKGRALVMENYTWDQRAEEMFEQVPQIIERI